MDIKEAIKQFEEIMAAAAFAEGACPVLVVKI